MYYFINCLKAIATVLITNSHYAGIWPIADLAAGGLLGNILFFAASGFCLYNVRESFPKWYLKRILRIYPVMIFFTLLTAFMRDGVLPAKKDIFYLFVFPTKYIFLVWLMLLYVAFYLVAWFSKHFDKTTEAVFLGVALAWIAVYFACIDKSVYCIDDVGQPFILFLYFLSMLAGALFKKYFDRFRVLQKRNVVLLFVSLIVYLFSKLSFLEIQKIAFLQILNQISILAVLYFMFAVFMGLEEKLKKAPAWLNKSMGFIASITLHIYIVQFVVIRRLEGLIFPLNFIATTSMILLLAAVLYFAEYFVRKGILCLIDKTKRINNNGEASH